MDNLSNSSQELMQIIEQNSYYSLEINSVTITEGISQCYMSREKEEDIMEQTYNFRQFIKKMIARAENYIKYHKRNSETGKDLELALVIMMKGFYQTMQKIAEHSYYIYTGPLIYSRYATYEGLSKEELIEVFQLLGREYSSTNIIERKLQAILNLAYLNIQQQNMQQAETIIIEIEKVYNQLITQFGQRNNSSVAKEEKIFCQTNETLYNQKVYVFIQNLKSLMMICTNDLNKLIKHITVQQELYKIIHSSLVARVKVNYQLLNSYFLYQNQGGEVARKYLKKAMTDLDIKEGCLVFFNNPNKFCIQLLDFLYTCIQNNTLHKAVEMLQKIELRSQKLTTADILYLKKLMNKYEGAAYKHGKLIILQQTNIASYLYRISNQFKKSIEQIKSYRFLINPPPKISFFMNYQLQLSQMYERVKNNENSYQFQQQQYSFKSSNEIQQGGMSIIQECNDGNLNQYIAKGRKSNVGSLILHMNEASMQQVLNHRSIIKVYDIVILDNERVQIIQKKQGNNLRQLLKQQLIEQDTRNEYIFQILHAFSYLNSLGILHSDLKLENIVAMMNNIKKIKIIDFGLSQINLSDNIFDALGCTKQCCPFEIKNNKQCDLDADIFMIGRIFQNLFTDLENEDQNQPNQNTFLISDRFKKFINDITDQDQGNRPSLQNIFRLFRCEVFIQKLYACLNTYLPIEEQKSYYDFSTHFYCQFDKFLDFKYQSFLFKQDKEPWNSNKLEDYGIYSKKLIKMALDQMISSQETYFIDCCFERDIYYFVIDLTQDSSSLDLSIKQLQLAYQKEDEESKTEMNLDSLLNDKEDEKPHHLGVFSDFQNYSAQKQEEIREILDCLLKETIELEKQGVNQPMKNSKQTFCQIRDSYQIGAGNPNSQLQKQNSNMIQAKQSYSNYTLKNSFAKVQTSWLINTKTSIPKVQFDNFQEKCHREPQVNINSLSKLQYTSQLLVQNQMDLLEEEYDIDIKEIISNCSTSTSSCSFSSDSNI